MNGMLRDLLSERADAAGSPDLDLHDLIARGERRVTRRRRVTLGGTAAAVVLTVGASFALVQAGNDRTSPPVSPPTNQPSNVDVPPDTTDGSRPLTYGVGATIHYGDRVIEAADDPDGLYVFDDGLWFFTGENAALIEVLTPQAFARASALGTRMVDGMRAAIADSTLPWNVAQMGTHSYYGFTPAPAHDGAESRANDDPGLRALMRLWLVNRGVWESGWWLGPTVSVAHNETDVDEYVDKFGELLEELTRPP